MSRLVLRRSSRHRSAVITRTPHRYWRVRAALLQGGIGNFSINTLQMRTVRGGADQCSGGTAIADSSYDGSALPANAFDGNDATLWSSVTGGSDHWIGYDLVTPKIINEMRIVGRSDYLLANALTLIMESSDDGIVWSLEWSHTRLANWTAGEARTLTRPLMTDANQYWRILILANYGFNASSIAELELRGTVGGPDIASGATFTADSEYDGTVPISKARDGNPATFWTATDTALPHWVKAVFPTGVFVGQTAITARTDVPVLTPATIYVQTCTDDLTWRDSILLGYPSITAGETKLFNTAYA